jgi:hypothetical protein
MIASSCIVVFAILAPLHLRRILVLRDTSPFRRLILLGHIIIASSSTTIGFHNDLSSSSLHPRSSRHLSILILPSVIVAI